MASKVTLEHLRQALDARDPEFVSLLIQLVYQDDNPQAPPREGAYTFDDFLSEQRSIAYRKKSLEERAQFRIERIAALESPKAERPLPDRLRCHEVLLELWQCNDLFSRQCLLKVIADVPLMYGPFKALKRIFKEAEARNDTEIFGALAARFDMAFAQRSHGVSQRTLGYLVRRGWRYLRRVGESFPAIYADVATDFLVHYTGGAYSLTGSWILNHIFFHDYKIHSRTKFKFNWERKQPRSWRKYRAFDDLWKRSPRPLFTLLERADCEPIVEYATSALKSDFRSALREVESSWVARLIAVRSDAIDTFVVWILENVPQFEQSKFRELGLHDAVLQLFHSGSGPARKYVTQYARTYARDLNLSLLVTLANNQDENVRKLAIDLLQSRDPRKEVGIDGWGQLLRTNYGYSVAEEALRKHFGASELTPEWFVPLIMLAHGEACEFGKKRLLQLHPRKKLGWSYFTDLIERLSPDEWEHRYAAEFCCEELAQFDLTEIPQEPMRRLLMHPLTQANVKSWVREGRIKASDLGAEFLKAVAYEPAYLQHPVIAEVQQSQWGKDLQFNQQTAETVLDWLGDVRQFMPDDLGFEWLLELVGRSEPLYHKFAVETMIKVFLPADFAAESREAPSPEEAASEIAVDFEGASFVFTGKLATMNRSEAKAKVTAAGGANSDSVTKKLDYLVIGDEGSPLYGQGRKGSKQTKAEKLNEDSAGIRIISETAFLQMLSGEQREFSDDAIQAGCQRLWSMMVDAEKPDAPLARFARAYIRRHHPDICLAETDRPVDPGSEIPASFLDFERVLPLFHDKRTPLRELALELAKWEFANWAPSIDGLVTMCESPFEEVRQFVSTAMTADDLPDHRRYRVDPDVLTADAVYSFCESRNRETRQLGMKLIDMHPRLKVPDELFRLTESPDASVRAFVIRAFWSLYRDRGITTDWKPAVPPQSKLTNKKTKQVPMEELVGSGAPPRPENLPATFVSLEALMRRVLFEVPPGRPPKGDGSATDTMLKMRRLPARLAKLNLIETLRDLAMEDVEFAKHVLPLLREFQQSRGKSEHAACLVAVTRIEHQHRELRIATGA